MRNLGLRPNIEDNEMVFLLTSKSKTDKRGIRMSIEENGGRFDCTNNVGENVVRITVGNDGGGVVDLRDKFGYKR